VIWSLDLYSKETQCVSVKSSNLFSIPRWQSKPVPVQGHILYLADSSTCKQWQERNTGLQLNKIMHLFEKELPPSSNDVFVFRSPQVRLPAHSLALPMTVWCVFIKRTRIQRYVSLTDGNMATYGSVAAARYHQE